MHGAEEWRKIVEELLDADAADYPGKEEDKLRASFKAKCKQAWLSRWDALLRFTAELLKCKRQGGVSHRALGVAKDTTEARLIVRYFNRHVGPFPLENGQARIARGGSGCPFAARPPLHICLWRAFRRLPAAAGYGGGLHLRGGRPGAGGQAGPLPVGAESHPLHDQRAAAAPHMPSPPPPSATAGTAVAAV